MKQIQPVIFPLNLGTATFLNCVGSDNFIDIVIINYVLTNEENFNFQCGSINMSGFDYEAYNTSPDGNEFIYNWTAQQIGVTLI